MWLLWMLWKTDTFATLVLQIAQVTSSHTSSHIYHSSNIYETSGVEYIWICIALFIIDITPLEKLYCKCNDTNLEYK